MNPLIVIAGFIVILAVLIYYLQNREEPDKKIPLKKSEKNVIKVRDYEAQYKAEQQNEKPVEESVKENPITEPAIAEEIDDIAQLRARAGVGPKYQELLRAAGYKSIKAIAETSPENLHAILLKVNEEKEITKRPPTLRNIEEWIKSAASHPE